MKSTPEHSDDASLAALGLEASRLVMSNELAALHERFGYALAFDREPINALEQDIAAALAAAGASSFGDFGRTNANVSHFKPNDTGLRSLVECLLPTNGMKPILLELVVTARESEVHVTLEQVSAST